MSSSVSTHGRQSRTIFPLSPMRINKLPPHLSHICAYLAVRNYMDVHRDNYERLQPRGIWLHYNSSTQVNHTTLAQDTRQLMILARIDKRFGPAIIKHAMITYWQNNGIPIETAMDCMGHRSARLVMMFYDFLMSLHDIMAEILAHGDLCDDNGDSL